MNRKSSASRDTRGSSSSRHLVTSLWTAIGIGLASMQVAAQSAGQIVNAPTNDGTVAIGAGSANLDLGALRRSGQASAGGAPVTDGSVAVRNGKAGNIHNAPVMHGDTRILSTGEVIVRSVVVDGGAQAGDLTNNPKREGNLTVLAGGVQGHVGFTGIGASTTGGVVADSIVFCGGKAGNVTNAGRMKGDAFYAGGHVVVNSVTLGCP